MDIVIHKAPLDQPLLAGLADLQASINAMTKEATDAYLKLVDARLVFGADVLRDGAINYSIMVKGSTA